MQTKNDAEQKISAKCWVRRSGLIGDFLSHLLNLGIRRMMFCDLWSSLPTSATPSPERSYTELDTLDPNAEHWRSVQIEEAWYYHVFRSSFRWSTGASHPILRLVADDIVREVVFVAEDGRWAYHPYDGGGDLICPDVKTRNDLAARYREWLSEHPLGL